MTDRPHSFSGAASSTSNRRSLGCLTALLGLALISALLGGFVFYRTQTAASGLVRDAFMAVAHLQPKVTVNEHVVLEQNSPVFELAVVERDISVERETTDSWLGSTKRLRVRATYHVKAGFDLRQPFDVHIGSLGGGKIDARLPPARLLSSEQVRVENLNLEDGLWNPISPDEIKAELNSLNTEARLKALEAGMPKDAERMLTDQLREKLGSRYPVNFLFAPPRLPLK